MTKHVNVDKGSTREVPSNPQLSFDKRANRVQIYVFVLTPANRPFSHVLR